jgi:hypothetical protein
MWNTQWPPDQANYRYFYTPATVNVAIKKTYHCRHLHLPNLSGILEDSSSMSQTVTGRFTSLLNSIGVPVGIIILVIVAGPA